MKTNNEFKKNIQDGIVTQNMLASAIYSVNKRAKNCRDKIREYRSNKYFRDRFNYIDKYYDKKEEYYGIKEKLLSFSKPDCIHKELNHYTRKRIYDYEDEYYEVDEEAVVHCNSYYDSFEDRVVEFVDIEDEPVYRYYLFYDLGEYSFHSPIDEDEIETKYSRLPIKGIDKIETRGKEVNDLVSMNFVNKVIKILDKGAKVVS